MTVCLLIFSFFALVLKGSAFLQPKHPWFPSFRLQSIQSEQCPSDSVCIVGGGFGGLYTALKLTHENPELSIILIDPKDKFVFLPLLYELAREQSSVVEVAPLYSDLLEDTPIKFVQAQVSGIDFEKQELSLLNTVPGEGGILPPIPYSNLVLATGCAPRVDMIPGTVENAIPFSTVGDAQRLKTRLRSLLDSEERGYIRAVVIGGGYSGVEMATSLAESIGSKRAVVSIIDRNSKIMSSSPSHNQETADKSLRTLGVSTYLDTSVVEIESNRVKLVRKAAEDDEEPSEEFWVDADLVILTAGVRPSPLLESISALVKDEFGRIKTSRTLQTLKYPNVFALGDCAGVDGTRIPSTAQAAMQQSDIVALNVAERGRSLLQTGEEPSFKNMRRFSFVPLGEMMTLGEEDASVSSLGQLVKLSGSAAAVARRLVYIARMPTNKQRVSAAVSAFLSQAAMSKRKSS
jgi:NADH dehydrogenase